MRYSLAGLVIGFVTCGTSLLPARADIGQDALIQAQKALSQGKTESALSWSNKAVALDPANAQAYFLRGVVEGTLARHNEAIADFSKTLELDPKAADAYNRRGSEHFKLGHINESIADFDRFLKLKPEQEPGHWMRGISYYYAGRYEEGRKQFEGYEKVDTNDVENAVWRYLCMARTMGVDKARSAILKIGNDRRVPMMMVYDLFSGRAKPEDVLTAVQAGSPKPEELKQRLFYAHLYLGLYYEAQGDRTRALSHMSMAAKDYRTEGYMGDVARVHMELRRKNKER
jgi:lipoprotein NlpI